MGGIMSCEKWEQITILKNLSIFIPQYFSIWQKKYRNLRSH